MIPAFNEEHRITTTLDTLAEYLSEQSFGWEILVVDDGSTDSTAQVVAERATVNRFVRLRSGPHRGKGWAVKSGMLAVKGHFRLMFDADMAMSVHQIGSFMEYMDEGADIVIGSREGHGAQRHGEPLARHLRGRVFNWAVRLLAVSGFDDTQCGFKCFRGDVADRIFELQRVTGFAFDVELLYLARRMGLNVLELPIDWYHDGASKVRPLADTCLMLRDVAMIRIMGLRCNPGGPR